MNALNPKGHSPIFKAVYYDFPDVIRVLAKHGANVNQRDIDNQSLCFIIFHLHFLAPLQLAASRNLAQTFTTLVELGADIRPQGTFIPLLDACGTFFLYFFYLIKQQEILQKE